MDHPIPVGEQHQVMPSMFSVVHIEVLKNSDHIILHLMVHLNQKTGLHGSTGFNIKYHADPRGSSTITFFTGAKATARVAWY